MSADHFRELSSLVGTLSLGLMLWRIPQSWHRMTPGFRITSTLLASLTTICVLGTAYAVKLHAPFNPFQLALLTHYCVSILVSFVGPRVFTRLGWFTDEHDVTTL